VLATQVVVFEAMAGRDMHESGAGGLLDEIVSGE
jgi:hypothetical protein